MNLLKICRNNSDEASENACKGFITRRCFPIARHLGETEQMIQMIVNGNDGHSHFSVAESTK